VVKKRDSEVNKRKELAIKAAKEAGKILKAHFGRTIQIRTKGERSLVTDVDLKAEEKIVNLIKRDYPRDNILSEETKYQTFDSDFRWIIDPLDGTHNYIRGMENFGTSIALAYRDKVILGVIYLPMSDELYFTEKGKGAFLNQRKISVSRKDLDHTTMIYDSTIRLNKGPMLKYLDRLVDFVFNIRMFGSTVRSLTYVAEGKADLEVEYNDKPWDFAAGLLLVEEAGGKATDLKGKRWTLNSKGYIASNGRIHSKVLKIIK
jgi:myo-inositol-1(or 4)-monophosphatase